MIRPELEALLQGALDNTLTADERAELARILAESPEARERAAELSALTGLIESLGPADAPAGLVDNVLAQVSHHPHVIRHATFQRGIAVNKKILFGLAAAAAIVLAVITYNSNPPATVGTEATIGAAQRAQAPQIAAKDVKLGDTSTQDILQTETFDAIMKDETLRNMLQDAQFRDELRKSAGLRDAFQDGLIIKALNDPLLAQKLGDQRFVQSLSAATIDKKYAEDASMHAMRSNIAFAQALKSQAFLKMLKSPVNLKALTGPAMQVAVRDQGFAAALGNQRFVASLSSGRLAQ
jgi:hypothetical protein